MALPSKIIIKLGKFVWTTLWHQMMSRLAPRSASGEYLRPPSEFRNQICSEPNHPYPAEKNRYCLYVGLSCPWAHRTLIVRALKGLEDVIPVVYVVAKAMEGGWVFETPEKECHTLAQFYRQAYPNYTGRATVPVLWDTQTQTIVNNESAEIIQQLNAQFNAFAARPDGDLYPVSLQPQIDALNAKIYETVNNGVYRCGLAQTQQAYEQACIALFATLDELEAILAQNRYLCGDQLTLADVRLFTTLFRFDAAYYGLFKCDRRRIRDYPHLWGYARDIYQLPGIVATCNLEKVKQDYYHNLFPLNPGEIVPLGADEKEWLIPHQRENLTQKIAI